MHRARARRSKHAGEGAGSKGGSKKAGGGRGKSNMEGMFFEEEMPRPGPKRGGKSKEKDTRLYELLGVTPEASEAELKRAYRQKVVQLHPDKNPDPAAHEQFKEITAAYEILSNPETRAVYDQYGEKGLKEGMEEMPGGFPDFFQDLFGGGHPFGDVEIDAEEEEEEDDRPQDVHEMVKVTLEELYTGATKDVKIQRAVECPTCSGSGTKPGKQRLTCRECHGEGVKVMRQQMFMFVQEVPMPCRACGGEGHMIRAADRCRGCDGRRTVESEATVQVPIPAGANHGEHVTVPNEGHRDPDMEGEPGNLVVMLEQVAHATFKRRGADLFTHHTISLTDALCGVSFPLQHLDGRTLLIKSTPGEIIKNGDIKAVHHEGMPNRTNPHLKGQLLIQFDVEFPETIPAEMVAALLKIMPRTEHATPMDAEECFLHAHVQHHGGAQGSKGGHAGHHFTDERDDEDHHQQGGGGGGDPRAQCVHM